VFVHPQPEVGEKKNGEKTSRDTSSPLRDRSRTIVQKKGLGEGSKNGGGQKKNLEVRKKTSAVAGDDSSPRKRTARGPLIQYRKGTTHTQKKNDPKTPVDGTRLPGKGGSGRRKEKKGVPTFEVLGVEGAAKKSKASKEIKVAKKKKRSGWDWNRPVWRALVTGVRTSPTRGGKWEVHTGVNRLVDEWEREMGVQHA